jgi:quercetin dioxygenase-like cupin family protein
MKIISVSSCFLFLPLLLLTLSCQQKPALEDPLEAGWKGEAVCEVMKENKALRVLKCTFPPGVGHERHYHAQHFGFTVKGSQFRITDASGTREVDVPTGSDFFNEKIEWHEVLNIGSDTAVFLIMESK